MPLKARLNGQNILSFSLPENLSWEDVREASRNGHVTMACCGVPAIPKTMHEHGTRFFAHKVRHDCSWAGESIEHEMFKAAAAQAAIDVEWKADTEVTGPDWRADVLAEKDGRRVAIEIQLSPQTAPETVRRTDRYAADGVTVIWLFRKMPAGLRVGPMMPAFEIQDADHVTCLVHDFLRGDLVWNTPISVDVPVTFVGYDKLCSRCGTVWYHVSYHIRHDCEVEGGLPNKVLPSILTPSHCPTCHLLAKAKDNPLSAGDAAWWPGTNIDGTEKVNLPGGWGDRRHPPIPYKPKGTVQEWRHRLKVLGLDLDDDDVNIWGASLRKAWQDKIDAAAREREAAEKRREDARRQAEQEEKRRRWEGRLVVEDILSVRGPISVRHINADQSSGFSHPVFLLKFPYDPDIIEHLKDTFTAKWVPDQKVWEVTTRVGGHDGGTEDLFQLLRDVRYGRHRKSA